MRYPGAELFLMIYDLEAATRQPFPLTDIPEFVNEPGPLLTWWGETGIMLLHVGLNDETFELEETFLTYDAEGEEIARIVLPATTESDFIYEKVLLKDGDEERIGALFTEQGWLLVDPLTGDAEVLEGVVERYSVDNPDGMSLLFSLDSEFNYNWTMADGDGIYTTEDGSPTIIENFNPSLITLSGDDQMAYVLFDGVYTWNDDLSTFLDGTETAATGAAAVAWAPTDYRARRDLDLTVNCPNVQESQLSGGIQGRVTSSFAVRVRDAATTSGNFITEMPTGTVFDVLEGPVCADGYAWFKVNVNGREGWSAEGDDSSYWLVPSQ